MKKEFYLRAVLTMLITSIICSYFGQLLITTIEFFSPYYKYLIYFAVVVLFFTKKINNYLGISHLGMKYFIKNTDTYKAKKKSGWYFPVILSVNTLLAHATGASVGREGVAVQLGGAVGDNLSKNNFNDDMKKYLIRLGMICGFSALFQTPLAAVFFIIETTKKRVTNIKNEFGELLSYVILAVLSSRLSHTLGLEKFSVKINNTSNYTFVTSGKLLLASLIIVLIGIVFVIVQKNIRKYVSNNYIEWFVLALFIVISIITEFRYSSLGTNLINFSFINSEDIKNYDFIFKLILTTLCTGIGFSGGEVTPLFAIGASLGIVLGNVLGLPVLLLAAIGYVIVFGAATKTAFTPMLLALEVFGVNVMLVSVLPSLLICLLNKRHSIYN